MIKLDMTNMISTWLAVREDWLHGGGGVCLDNFKTATGMLYVAFLESSGTVMDIQTTYRIFQQFCIVLAQENDQGIPQRAEFHSRPIMVGHA